MLPERLLHGVEDFAVGEALDGGDLVTVRLDREHGARLHRLTVEQHGARATRRGVAPDVRAREADDLPEVVHEEGSCLHRVAGAGAVDRDLDLERGLFSGHEADTTALRRAPFRTSARTLPAMRIDDPEVLAEVRAEFARYETALVANDREALVAFFLDSPTTVRYGIDDAQYGHDELAAFRRSEAVATPPRDLQRTVMTAFGRDF